MSDICPKFEAAMGILGKRWNGLIIHQLLEGPKRFSELEHAILLSGKVLSDRLKELEDEGIVVRHVHAETPVRIEYDLTEKGRDLRGVLDAVADWADTWNTNKK
jgi:DNA-binding HxlR family transcriptional regulator